MEKLQLSDYDDNYDGVIDADEFGELEQDFNEKLQRAQKTKSFGAKVLITAFTLLSLVSSYWVYKQGWLDISELAGTIAGAAGTILIEGMFLWLLFGQKNAFSTAVERSAGYVGIVFAVFTMVNNILIHYRSAKGMRLSGFQHWWLEWGAIIAFAGVVALVLIIELADPLERLFRMSVRVYGKEKETEISAKNTALKSATVAKASRVRAKQEARSVAQRLVKGSDAQFIAARPRGDDAFVYFEEPQPPRGGGKRKNG